AVMESRPVPTLDALLADPALALRLEPERAEALLLALAPAFAAITEALRLAATRRPPEPQEADDQGLTAEQAAAMLGVTPRWLRDHGGRFRVPALSDRLVVYSKARIQRHLGRSAQ